MSTPAKIALAISLAAGIFVAGYVTNRQPGSAATSSSRQVLYYTCPMHPSYRSDHPGDAPCCGMRLVPVYAGDAVREADTAPEPRGTVQIPTSRQQLIGLRIEEVRRASTSHVLRVPGRIAVDETRLYRIVAAADGWVRKIGPNTAGALVRSGEMLASYYTPNLQATEQSFLFAFATGNQLEREELALGSLRPTASVNLQVAIDALRSLGMSDRQIEELHHTRKLMPEIQIYSPAAGFVVARNISPEQRFEKGSELYQIADIGRVWVTAGLFEKERAFLKPGAIATLRHANRELRARMSDVLPQFDPQSRTLQARFELDNPDYVLRPGMFVDVEIHVEMPEAVTVPADAVVDTGLRRTVFVDRGSGAFEPREVETGWRLGNRVQIASGLKPGERIVVSGNFLVDSESRMQLAAAGAAPAEEANVEIDPVCGMEVDPKAPDAIKTQHGGKTYYFCSPHCKKSFEADPGKYMPKKPPAESVAAARGSA